MVSVLVTGTNQGIGLGLIRQLAKRSDIHHIFATVRDPESSGTADLKRLASGNPAIHIVRLELNESSIAAAAEEVKRIVNSDGLDILINNIGIGQEGNLRPEEVTAEVLREQFEVNVIGPHLITKAMLPLLKEGKKKIIVNTLKPRSSIAGSITYNDGRYPWLVPAYGTSKAALNFLTCDWAKDLKPEGFIVIALYPGWVKTRAAPAGQMTTDESATGILNVVFNLKSDDAGTFLAYDGQKHPW